MLAGVIFDFDGVIANSEPLHLQAYQDVLKRHGVSLSPADYYERYLGFDDVGVFCEIAKHHGWDLSEETLKDLIRAKGRRYVTLVQHGESLFPGAADCIARVAAEVPIAIASGALAPEIEALLAATNLRHHFEVVVASGDTERSKPAPDPYLRAVDLVRTRTESTGRNSHGTFVAIEDSRWGIESAVAAGLRCIGVAQTYPIHQLDTAHLALPAIADVTIARLHEVCSPA